MLTVAQSLLFPPRCLACRAVTGSPGALCAGCWEKMHFIAPPFCRKCGLAFDCAIGVDAWCGECLRAPPPYAGARAVLRYDDASRSPLLAFKYHDKTEAAPVFGHWLARAGAEFCRDAELILPVPLHYRRRVARRYNQAGLLAAALAAASGLAVRHDLLHRRRATRPQAGLTRRERQVNLRGAFHVPPAKKPLLKQKTVLLVDDVMTTGATLHACCRVLRDAGVRDIYVLTLARVVRGQA